MATTSEGSLLKYTGTGSGDTTTIIQTDDISRFDVFGIMITGGSCQVLALLDADIDYSTAVCCRDFSAATISVATTLTAGKLYELRAKVQKLKIVQSGAGTPNAVLVCGNMIGS